MSDLFADLLYILANSLLFVRAAMLTYMLDLGTSNESCSFPVCQADNQKSAPETDFCAIDNEADLSKIDELTFRLIMGDGLVPYTYSNAGLANSQPKGG